MLVLASRSHAEDETVANEQQPWLGCGTNFPQLAVLREGCLDIGDLACRAGA